MPSPDSTMQPSMQPSSSARAACTIRTASRIPPDFASLTLIPCARSAHAGDVVKRVAVLVDVDRDGRALLELGTARIARGQRLLAVLDAELGQRRQRLEGLLQAPRLVDVDLERQVAGDPADRSDALDVEPVAAAELELEAPEAVERRLCTARHVVGIAEPHRPARRRPGPAQPEQPPDGLAEQLALQVVERGVDRRAGGELAGRQPFQHLLERERIVPQQVGVLLEIRQRRLGGLAVAVDRLRLAEAGHARVPQLDDHDVLAVARAARDDERLREVERDDPRRDVHGRNVPTPDRR